MDLFTENSLKFVPIAILGASLIGSGHCVAMCGGLVSMVARNSRAIATYHVARLLGYCTLGAVAGALGKQIFQTSAFKIVPWIATIAMSIVFIGLGLRVWQRKPLHVFRIPMRVFEPISRLLGRGPAATGFLSALLPCGWLHTFVLGAVATQSAALGALYLFIFWLGTLPALSLTPLLIKQVFRPFAQSAPKLSAVILISVGLASIGMKMMSQSPGHSCPVCHSSREGHPGQVLHSVQMMEHDK